MDLKRLSLVSACISFGLVALVLVSIHVRDNVELANTADMNSKVLGLKEADMRLLQAAIHAQKSKDTTKCAQKCHGDMNCAVLCGQANAKGHHALPAQSFNKLLHLTKKAVADNGGAFGLASSDVKLLQSALQQQVKEQVKACRNECKSAGCQRRCHNIAKTLEAVPAHAAHKHAGHKHHSTKHAAHHIPANQNTKPAHHHREHVRKHLKATADSSNKPAVESHKHHASSAKHSRGSGLGGLRASDLALLKAAQGDQAKDDARRRQRAAALRAALHPNGHGDHDASAGLGGDWAPGMRSSALEGLRQEQAQQRQTAKEAAEVQRDDSTSW